MPDEQELGLRERKALNTRRALSDAALELAFEQGLENVRRADIAERAGVSVRTFNNYFAGKYEAIAYRQIERIHRGVAGLRAYPADAPLWTAIIGAMVEPLEAEGVTEVPGIAQVREIRKMRDAAEINVATMRRVFAADGDLAAAIAERTGTDPARDLYPRLVAAAIGVAFQSAFEMYTEANPPEPVTTLLRRALAAIAAGLPDPSARN